jgi:hypothetical protein
MADAHDRHIEASFGGEGGAVQVDEIRANIACEIRDGCAGAKNLGRALGRPVERQSGLDEVEAPDGGSLVTLIRGGRRAEHGQRGQHTPLPKPAGKVERVSPDAAHGVGGHQDSRAGQHAQGAPQQARSSSGRGAGRSSWMSLKASNWAR